MHYKWSKTDTCDTYSDQYTIRVLNYVRVTPTVQVLNTFSVPPFWYVCVYLVPTKLQTGRYVRSRYLGVMLVDNFTTHWVPGSHYMWGSVNHH